MTKFSSHFVSKEVITVEDEELIYQTTIDKAKNAALLLFML